MNFSFVRRIFLDIVPNKSDNIADTATYDVPSRFVYSTFTGLPESEQLVKQNACGICFLLNILKSDGEVLRVDRWSFLCDLEIVCFSVMNTGQCPRYTVSHSGGIPSVDDGVFVWAVKVRLCLSATTKYNPCIVVW